jgi:hypothetical protein
MHNPLVLKYIEHVSFSTFVLSTFTGKPQGYHGAGDGHGDPG